jgi:hypothetical protein
VSAKGHLHERRDTSRPALRPQAAAAPESIRGGIDRMEPASEALLTPTEMVLFAIPVVVFVGVLVFFFGFLTKRKGPPPGSS